VNPLVKEFIVFFAVWPLVICAGVYFTIKLGKSFARLASQPSASHAIKKNVHRVAS